jgi:hypothetical protein
MNNSPPGASVRSDTQRAGSVQFGLRLVKESRDFCRQKRESVAEIPGNKLLQLQWKHSSCFMEVHINICVLVCWCAGVWLHVTVQSRRKK